MRPTVGLVHARYDEIMLYAPSHSLFALFNKHLCYIFTFSLMFCSHLLGIKLLL
jgi:hypothetical protein